MRIRIHSPDFNRIEKSVGEIYAKLNFRLVYLSVILKYILTYLLLSSVSDRISFYRHMRIRIQEASDYADPCGSGSETLLLRWKDFSF